MPKLTVTIIAQNEAATIGEVLDAIRCADEVLVVDGGSIDGTQEELPAPGGPACSSAASTGSRRRSASRPPSVP